MDQKEKDQFERIERHRSIERSREIIESYQRGMAYYRTKIEVDRYWIGRLDERLEV